MYAAKMLPKCESQLMCTPDAYISIGLANNRIRNNYLHKYKKERVSTTTVKEFLFLYSIRRDELGFPPCNQTIAWSRAKI